MLHHGQPISKAAIYFNFILIFLLSCCVVRRSLMRDYESDSYEPLSLTIDGNSASALHPPKVDQETRPNTTCTSLLPSCAIAFATTRSSCWRLGSAAFIVQRSTPKDPKIHSSRGYTALGATLIGGRPLANANHSNACVDPGTNSTGCQPRHVHSNPFREAAKKIAACVPPPFHFTLFCSEAIFRRTAEPLHQPTIPTTTTKNNHADCYWNQRIWPHRSPRDARRSRQPRR